MKIVVLAGGLSHEREVSLSSGSLIAAALVRNGHSVCLADLYTGKGIDGTSPAFSSESISPYVVSRTVPDLDVLKAATGNGDRRIGEGILSLCHEADCVFIALHGDVGENGQLQALFDMEGIRYTGSGYAGSLLAMDKDLSKQILHRAGVPTPPWVLCRVSEGVSDVADRIEREIGYPCVIKPCTSGSSVGVSMPTDRAELEGAIAKAAVYEDTVMAERRIVGRELTVSVLGDRVLPPVEIIPLCGFYDYENKYQSGKTQEICPADLTQNELDALVAATKQGFDALRLGHYARLDFMLDENGTPWCLEANTLPGMTPTSLLPQAAAAVGISYDELCERMVRLAVE
jgi:D-alanine-D-alanine ligase